MAGYPNIYTTVVFDLHPKVKDFMDQLNNDGQIDLDQSGHPYLVSCNRQGANIITQISRNNRLENFVLNPRKKVAPLCSWNMGDGFQRPDQKRVTVIQDNSGEPSRKERQRRPTNRMYESIIDGILEA